VIVLPSPDGRELEELTDDEIVALYRDNWSAWGSKDEAAAYGSVVAGVLHGNHDGPPVD